MSSRAPLRGYSEPGALLVGVMQIMIGLVMMCLQVPFSIEDLLPAQKAVGIWAGLIFTCSGSLCVVSSRVRTKPMVISMLVVASIVWILCVSAGIVAYIMMLLGTMRSLTDYRDQELHKFKVTEMVSYSQVGMCVIQGMLEIAAIVLCSRALCVCCGASTTEPAVLYVKRQDEKGDLYLLED